MPACSNLPPAFALIDFAYDTLGSPKSLGVLRTPSAESPRTGFFVSGLSRLASGPFDQHRTSIGRGITQHDRFIQWNFSKSLAFAACHGIGATNGPRCEMNGLSWDHLDASEQRVLGMLADGVSTDLCDPVALMTLRRIGLVSVARLTVSGEQLLSTAVRRAFAA
jgi:hypothetical protein